MARVFTVLGRQLTSATSRKKFPPVEIKGLTDVKPLVERRSVNNERRDPLHWRYPEVIDWANIWPAASTFNYSIVPFPVRQGYCKNLAENQGVSPGKYANAELMKIPNFLHLTAAHIKKHCDALKKLCTQWPPGLNTDENIEKYYPVEVITRNYVFSAASIRDPRARIVTLRVRLGSLGLDDRAKRKLLRLAIGPGPGRNFASYNWDTDILQLETGRCPISKQNADYLTYVFTVLTLESKKIEHWESDSPNYDWLYFDWSKSEARKRLVQMISNSAQSDSSSTEITSSLDKLDSIPEVEKYRKALESIWSENDILNGDQWIQRPDPPRKRHCRFPPIKNVPFQTVPGADKSENLNKYAVATRKLLGLST